MMRIRTLAAVCLGLTLAACNDMTGPLGDVSFDGRKAKGQTGDAYSSYWSDLFPNIEIATIDGGSAASGINPDDVPANTLEHSQDAPALQAYATTFTHTAGQKTVFQLNYKADGWHATPFLYLTIPADAQVRGRNGKVVREGKQVEITVEVDLEKFLVHFGPHGSTFLANSPAELWFKYEYAKDTDRDTDGMNMWYQPEVGAEWTQLETVIDTFGYWARAKIYHFSNYAVAW